jgi:MFS family permease
MVAESDVAGMERWFVDRGLPHFVERRDSATAIWGRALPLLVPAYLLLGLNALNLVDYSVAKNLAVAAFVLAIAVVTWVVANVVRRRPAFDRPHDIGPAELAVFVLVPVVPSLIVGQRGDAVQTFLYAVGLLAVLWFLTSYGVPTLLGWAWQRTSAQLTLLLSVLARALPLLLLFSAFLFINAEAWQVAGTLTGPVYVAALGVFFVLGATFVLTRIPPLMRSLNTFARWGEIGELVDGTPASDVLEELRPDRDQDPRADRPSPRQRLNIGLLTVFSQAIQVTLVGVGLAAFFVVFGFLAIPEATAAAWTALDDVHVLLRWNVGGRALVITDPLLRVAGFLGAFGAMYFTVLLSTDAMYREEFADDVAPQLRQALAVRCVYRAARARR